MQPKQHAYHPDVSLTIPVFMTFNESHIPATLYICSVFATNLSGNSPPANVSAMTEVLIFLCTPKIFKATEFSVEAITY